MTMAHANTASHDSTDYVRIFDTTLRDGEQSPGCTMNVEEKIALARQLERLNVDIIEAGFAVSSPGDFESVSRVAQALTEPVVLSLSRTREEDVDSALRAVDKAAHPGIHIFIATSEIHLKYKLNMNREDVLDAATWAVTRAKKHLDYIEFSCEDASRSDRDQSARHDRPRDPRGVRPDVRVHARESSRRRQGNLECALPQRFGAGGRELAGGGSQRRPPDRMHRQRNRRARGQLLDGRSRDGDEDAARPDGRAVAGEHAPDLSGLAPALAGHRPVGAGQQANRRRQCVRA